MTLSCIGVEGYPYSPKAITTAQNYLTSGLDVIGEASVTVLVV